MIVVPGMLVRRSDMASLTRRRGDLTPKTQDFEKEQSNPVWAFARLRRLGFGFVTVSHTNLVSLIRIPRPSTHPANVTGERQVCERQSWSPGHLVTTQSVPYRRFGGRDSCAVLRPFCAARSLSSS